MKLIPLTHRKFAQVDDEDYDFLMQWKWYASDGRNGHSFYASRREKKNLRFMQMHRQILNLTDPQIKVDHKDGNGLNNQRSNIRPCTQSQNLANKRACGKSKYLGVSPSNRKTLKWYACIKPAGSKTISLGCFKTEEEAARAYDDAAKKHFGEFANLNFPDNIPSGEMEQIEDVINATIIYINGKNSDN